MTKLWVFGNFPCRSGPFCSWIEFAWKRKEMRLLLLAVLGAQQLSPALCFGPASRPVIALARAGSLHARGALRGGCMDTSMAAATEVKAFMACSLDGFIAGPNGELDWLPGPEAGAEDTFTPFMSTVTPSSPLLSATDPVCACALLVRCTARTRFMPCVSPPACASQVGALLMGRKTFDIVHAMGPEMW